MKITQIPLDRMRLDLDPPFLAAWDPVPRRHFDATLVRIETDAGITGYGSGDTMDGFAAVAEHTWTNGLGLLARLHVAAGVGGGPYLEFPYDPPGWTPQRRDFLLTEPVGIEADGTLRVPDRPGLGAEIDEAAVARWARS